MRTTTIQTTDPAEAREAAPWACGIFRCEGGFTAFEDARAAEMWLAGIPEDGDRTDYSLDPGRDIDHDGLMG